MRNNDTKTALLDTAEDLIQRVGVNAMSYTDLSIKVGIKKASIHHHFPKKDDLIIALINRYRENYGAKYEAIVYSNKSAIDKLFGIAQIFEDSLKEKKMCLIGMLSTERETLTEKIKNIIKKSTCDAVTLYEKMFIQGQEEGVIGKDVETQGAAYVFLSFLVGSQIFMRSTDNIEGFNKSVKEYIKMITCA